MKRSPQFQLRYSVLFQCALAQLCYHFVVYALYYFLQTSVCFFNTLNMYTNTNAVQFTCFLPELIMFKNTEHVKEVALDNQIVEFHYKTFQQHNYDTTASLQDLNICIDHHNIALKASFLIQIKVKFIGHLRSKNKTKLDVCIKETAYKSVQQSRIQSYLSICCRIYSLILRPFYNIRRCACRAPTHMRITLIRHWNSLIRLYIIFKSMYLENLILCQF